MRSGSLDDKRLVAAIERVTRPSIYYAPLIVTVAHQMLLVLALSVKPDNQLTAIGHKVLHGEDDSPTVKKPVVAFGVHLALLPHRLLGLLGLLLRHPLLQLFGIDLQQPAHG